MAGPLLGVPESPPERDREDARTGPLPVAPPEDEEGARAGAFVEPLEPPPAVGVRGTITALPGVVPGGAERTATLLCTQDKQFSSVKNFSAAANDCNQPDKQLSQDLRTQNTHGQQSCTNTPFRHKGGI